MSQTTAADHLAEGVRRHLAELAGAAAALAGADRRAGLGAVAVAVLAGADRLERDLAAGALDHVGQLDLDRAATSPPPARPAAAAAEAADTAAEERLEDVVDRAEAGAARVEAAGAQALVAEGVVGARRSASESTS